MEEKNTYTKKDIADLKTKSFALGIVIGIGVSILVDLIFFKNGNSKTTTHTKITLK